MNVKLINSQQVTSTLQKPSEVLEIVERAFHIYDNMNVILPDKSSQIFDEKTQNRINCMPASVLNENISGVKWVSVFPNNPVQGLPNVNATILLSEITNGQLLAIMDGTEITSSRTAAVGACAAKYLARNDSKTIGFIGAGKEARAHLDLIMHVHPQIEKCFVSSRTDKTVRDFIEEKIDKFPQLKFINCSNNYEKSIVNADIIVTAISGQKDILKERWIKKGATYIHVGGWEDEYAVVEKADKIICDDWESVKHRGQTLSRMYKEGKIKNSDIYSNLKEVLNGEKQGRESDDEFIYFNSVGLAFIDILFAKYVYENLKDNLEKNEEFNF